MARCRFYGYFLKETDVMAADRIRVKRLPSGDGNHNGEFDVEGKKTRGVERAEGMKREPPSGNAVP